jgi:hypothetical protein
MGMVFEMRHDLDETEAIQRRARVIVYRLSLGEFVTISPHDRVANEVFRLLEERRREGLPCAAAEGATPFDW